MGKFNARLMEKVEKEEKEERKQETLKTQAGIENSSFYVKEKGMKDYLFSILHILLSVAVAVLIFIGIATLLNPESRLILFTAFPFP